MQLNQEQTGKKGPHPMLGTFRALPTMQVYVTQGKDHDKPRGKVSSQGQCAHKSEGTQPLGRERAWPPGSQGESRRGPSKAVTRLRGGALGSASHDGSWSARPMVMQKPVLGSVPEPEM